MGITKLTTNLNNISALSDSPNTAPDSLTATQMKAKFDKSASDIKTYNNDTLTVEIDAEIAALDATKINITHTELYNNATGIADGATNTTITGISNYHLFAIETDINTVIFNAVKNYEGNNIRGYGFYLSGADIVTVHLKMELLGAVDVITTLYIKNITHINGGSHSTVGTACKVTKIYGIL